ncbi:MAG TPA: Rieske 2Fe-2S domain-containing protein [Gaiellaceae bacterium]|nr:Rieske 2Fe-2S domain-containing protein [Gaiellaceae bacterium]
MDEPHIPLPTLWPLGFAVGIAVALVGLVVDPMVVSSIGAGIAIAFGFLWARDATAELRGHAVEVEPETRALRAPEPVAVAEAPAGEPAKVSRSRFLEAATLGLGGVIGGIVTVPVAGFALLPGFLGQKRHEVDLGPVTDFPLGKWFITTFVVDPQEGDVSRRTAFVRNNGFVGNAPSFTIISNRCAHLGCPVQANGPTGAILGEKNVVEHTANGPVLMQPVVPAGFGCPCHGGQYDTEGNRTAGPPVRALDRYAFDIKNGRLILLSTFSVTHVNGTGAQAKIHKYKLAGPGEHINGIEQILYPLQPPHH